MFPCFSLSKKNLRVCLLSSSAAVSVLPISTSTVINVVIFRLETVDDLRGSHSQKYNVRGILGNIIRKCPCRNRLCRW